MKRTRDNTIKSLRGFFGPHSGSNEFITVTKNGVIKLKSQKKGVKK